MLLNLTHLFSWVETTEWQIVHNVLQPNLQLESATMLIIVTYFLFFICLLFYFSKESSYSAFTCWLTKLVAYFYFDHKNNKEKTKHVKKKST